MHQGLGRVTEIFWEMESAAARLVCPPELIPAPGQYLQASAASDSPLPVSVFQAGASADGFLAAPPWPAAWTPGTRLHLRGPLGCGFKLPAAARHVALAALDDSTARLLPLMNLALQQGAAATLLCNRAPAELPLEVEIQPLAALADAFAWADYTALDVPRRSVAEVKSMLELGEQAGAGGEAQILVDAPMPCGGLADCGACALTVHRGWKMACKDGPVFDLRAVWD